MLIMVILTWCLCINSAEATRNHRFIQRLNYGVFFIPKGHFNPVSDYWAHTVQIVLPQYPDLKYYPQPCSKVESTKEICDMLQSALIQSEFIHNATGETCRKLVEKVQDLMPEVNLPDDDSRSKRSLLPFIGQLSKSIFGTATVRDVEILQSHISSVIQNSNKLESAFKYQSNKLSSFMSIVDNRITNAAKEIQINHKSIANMGNELWKLEWGLMVSSQLTGQLVRQVQRSSDLTSRLNELIKDIGHLMEGKLSPTLLSPSALKQILVRIQKQLKQHYPDFQISYKHPSHYYKSGLFVAARHNNSIFITLKIPVSAFKSTFKVYELFTVPVPINTTTKHATQLLNMPNIIAISNDNHYYATMSREQWQTCQGKERKYCPPDIVISPMTKYTCSLLIFQQMKTLIPEYCNFRLVKNALQPSILQVTTSQVLVANTSKITFRCKNSWKSESACHFCLMTVPCECSLQTENFYLPPTLHSCEKASTEITKLHPVNLALLQYFHDEESHKTISGNTLFHNEFNPKIPPFKFYEGKYEHFVVEDKKEHLDLKKVTEAVKRNEDIYESSADALIDLLPMNSTQWDIISMALNGTCFLTCIAVSIALFITCKKLKAMSVIILTLQQIHESKASPIQTIPPHFQMFSTNPVTTPSPHSCTISHAEFPIVTTVTAITFIILILWHMFKKYQTLLTVEVTNGSDSVQIEIQRLPLSPHYWNLEDFLGITEIDVKGFLLPKLILVWQNTSLINLLNDRKLPLSTKSNIHWFNAYKLRRILKTPFSAFVVIKHLGYAYPLKANNPAIQYSGLHDCLQVNNEKLYPSLKGID